MRETLSFDDVLLVPQYSEVTSRSMVDLSVKIKDFTFNHPIIPANMKTVTGFEMAKFICESGGLAVVHRFLTLQEQLDIVENIKNSVNPVINVFNHLCMSVGVKEQDKSHVEAFVQTGIKILCIDIAHGDSKMCVDMCKYIKQYHPNVLLIAGNVATSSGAHRLWDAGADVVKAGVGSGCLIGHMPVICSYKEPSSNSTIYDLHKSVAIEDVVVGDHVLTHTGKWKKVLNKIEVTVDELICSVNGIMCTVNHEFYAIDMEDSSKINNDNYSSYAKWIRAEDLTLNNGLVTRLHTNGDIKIRPIFDIHTKEYSGLTFDLTVEDDASYNISGVIVHNSLCTTRIETGNGFPQLSCIMDIWEKRAPRDVWENQVPNKYVISDGGLKSAGDMVKALCFSDMVMVGNLFSGTDETPGDLLTINGFNYKQYAGSSTHKANRKEGVVAVVPSKGPVNHVLQKLLEGIQSGCSYQGVFNLTDLKESPEFIKISHASLIESHPHDVQVVK